MAERDAARAAFGDDPDWSAIASNPAFAETIQSISDIILRPTAYSHI